ncbi:signal recognition particle-docking protein FtsY [Candidatus Woesearchaeota archaeon CG10_big_fil_rev_8_21_14_0_10_45_16]|nr:MAG: signal recognition particle-docking protein FtsY [Candidatus Woesearchaeota archaeon CG10_big_fil_rev_8_21_14_0_10_45_16]
MFGRLKDKLKGALSVFSKKTEEVAEEIKEELEEKSDEVSEDIEEPKEEPVVEEKAEVEKVTELLEETPVPKDIPTAEELIEATKKEFKEKKPKKKKEPFAEKIVEETKEVLETIPEAPKEEEKVEVPAAKEEKTEKEKIKGVKITYFVHGTTTDNEQDIATGWNPGELSELGEKQAKDLHKYDADFEVVFCSDLKRAIQSANLGFKGMVIQDEKLRECNYGKWNGKKKDWEIIDYVEKRYPEGESYHDVERRMAEFINYLYDNYYGQHIAIVAHQAPQLALEVLLNGKTWKAAITEDWRGKKAWQPGWEYVIEEKVEVPAAKEEKKGFFGKLFGKKKEEAVEEKVFEDEKAVEKITEKEVIPETKKVVEKTEEKIVENKPELKEKTVPTVEKKEKAVETKEKSVIEGKAVEIKERPVIGEKKESPKREEKVAEKPKEGQKSFFGKIKQSFTTKTISAEKFEELFWDLELILLENNVSVEVIDKIKEDLKEELVDKPLPRDVLAKIEETLERTLREILSYEKIDLIEKVSQKQPYVIAFFGINGAGKTTSIAKLAHYFRQNHKSVVLAACDTFRAAAIQQLEEHANKLGVKMIKHDYGSDAAAVAYDAIQYAQKNDVEVVLIDTAGRLHSNTNLMAELEKIIRVTKPDLKIFVGESITGNDCIEQARKFNELVEMDGAILTKADVDEKGGAPLSISYTIKKPILFLGVGQEYKDLEQFDAETIIKRLGF